MCYNELMDNKVAEKIQGGSKETKWDALKAVRELTPDEIIARRERNFGKLPEEKKNTEKEEKNDAEKLAEKKSIGKATEALVELEDVMADPEWQKPKIELFDFDQKSEISKDKITYPVKGDKLAAVPREKATWSFMNQVHEAKTVDDFQAANMLANARLTELEGELAEFKDDEEALRDVEEEIARIKDFRENPAYKMKETGFAVEGLAKRVDKDQRLLAEVRRQYTEARKGGPFKRLMNRMKIHEAKERMAWTERRLEQEKSDLKLKQAELDEFVKAAA